MTGNLFPVENSTENIQHRENMYKHSLIKPTHFVKSNQMIPGQKL